MVVTDLGRGKVETLTSERVEKEDEKEVRTLV